MLRKKGENKRYYEKHKNEIREKARAKQFNPEKREELGIPIILEKYFILNTKSFSLSVPSNLEDLLDLCKLIKENYDQIQSVKHSYVELASDVNKMSKTALKAKEIGVPEFLIPFLKINTYTFSLVVPNNIDSLVALCRLINDNFQEEKTEEK